MLITSRPHACNARIAASLPEPGPFTNTSTVFKPWIKAAFVAVSAAICAAYGVDFLEPLKPRPPALAQLSALPSASVRVTIVLLKDDWICACPRSTFFLTRFFVTFFVTLAIFKLTYFLFTMHVCILHVCILHAIHLHHQQFTYFFLFATVLFGPFLVLALVFVF